MQKINVSKFTRHIVALRQVKPDYKQPHEDAIEAYLQLLPYGSGIDAGWTFDWTKSSAYSLHFAFEYHHMEDGSYTGWTKHQLIISPCMEQGYKLRITGKNKSGVKEYLYDLISECFYFDPNQPTFEQPKPLVYLKVIFKHVELNNGYPDLSKYATVKYYVERDHSDDDNILVDLIGDDEETPILSLSFYKSMEDVTSDMESLALLFNISIEEG